MNVERNFGDRYHLIDHQALEERKIDREPLEKFVKESQIAGMGKNYNIVAVIGSQSTGKSTLLNHVFGTKFAVQDRTKGLGQTTVGIWLARDQKCNLLVLDVEGSDSVERKSGENMVENQTALLALAMSHAFIINVFLNSLGQHTSCQLSIIKIIMQMNLKLFKQDTVKNIIFVIRDWEEEASLPDATNRLQKYLLDIWKDIPKPEQFKQTQFEDLFKVQVFALSYFKMKKEFEVETQQLRDKLVNPANANYLFQGFDFNKNLPMDALPIYLANIWETISNNKDLNLPNEKILVSNLRCQQIKIDALESIKEELEKFAQSIVPKKSNKFGATCQEILKKAQSKYFEEAQDYQKEVQKDKHTELTNELLAKFYALFQTQSEHIKTEQIAKLETNLNELKKVSDIYQLPGFLATVSQTRGNFAEQIKESLLENVAWQQEDKIRQYNSQFDLILKSFVENQLTSYKQRLDKIIMGECDRIVGAQFLTISKQFWPQIEADYYALIDARYVKYETLLNDLNVSNQLLEYSLEHFENDSFSGLKQVLSQQSGRIKDQLFQQFKQKFCRLPDGQPRDWKKITEEEIFHIFTESRDEILALLEMLRVRKVKFLKQSQLKLQKKYQSAILTGSAKVTEDVFDVDNVYISDSFFGQIKTQIQEDFDIQYQDAIQKHKQDFLQNIPKPFWFLLLFFMYDDIFRWMGNPLILYPILIIICFVGFCIAIGLHNLPKVAFQQVIKHINGLIGPLIFGGLSKLKGG